MSDDVVDLAIVGAGFAGLSAAVQATRMGLRTLLIGDAVMGGQVLNADRIDNYPGVAAGATGADLIAGALGQAAAGGVELAVGEVTGLDAGAEVHRLSGLGGPWTARAVIIATGGRRRTLGVPGEADLTGRGVSDCGTCDGPLFAGRDVAVVGGGDAALDEALFLAGVCREVTVITRDAALSGAAVTRDRVAGTPNIDVLTHTEVTAVGGEQKVEHLDLVSGDDAHATRLPVSAVFVYIGADPATAAFGSVLRTDGGGHIVVDLHMRTNLPGVFAAGTCRHHSSGQLAAIAGDGVTAAIAAHDWIHGLHGEHSGDTPAEPALAGPPPGPEPGSADRRRGLSSPVVVADDLLAAIETAHRLGWTDGLPIVPPTEERVAAMLAPLGASPDTVVGTFDTRHKTITMEKVAINAVMAGCLPEHLPVVLALVRLTLAGGLSPGVSTSGWANVFIVNGPVRAELQMNSRGDVFGPGNRANASIGRAIQLIHRNAFGSVGGAGNDADIAVAVLDRSTIGQPAKYTQYHLVENEEDFPSLAPLHVQRGYAADQSVVTGMPVHWHAQLGVHQERGAEAILDTVNHHLLRHGLLKRVGSIVLVVPPELAGHLVDDGFTKADVGRYVFEGTRRSKRWMKENGLQTWSPASSRHEPIEEGDDDKMYAAAGTPDDVLTVVAGGPAGGFVHVIHPFPGMGFSPRAVSEVIE